MGFLDRIFSHDDLVLLDEEANIVTAFLSDRYTEGVCRHYASAATMIFRALKIPARYTIGYVPLQKIR